MSIKNSKNNITLLRESKKVVIIQHEAVHEEVITSFIEVMISLGMTVQVYINSKVLKRRGDLFAFFELDGSVKYEYVEFSSKALWLQLKERIKLESYDLALSTTFQRVGVVDWFMSLDLPILGCVHNVKMFLDNRIENKITNYNKPVSLVTLGNHVTNSLKKVCSLNAFTCTSCLWPTVGNTDDSIVYIGIPGGVSYDNRDYKNLLSTISLTFKESSQYKQFRYIIMGGGKDRSRLESEVTKLGIEEFFEFLPLSLSSGRVLYKDYINSMRKIKFIDPLLPSNSKYNNNKITSAVPTAIGFMKPIYTSRDFATATGFHCVGSQVDSQSQAIEEMIQMQDGEYELLKSLMKIEREKQLILMKLNLRSAMKILGFKQCII